MSAAPETAAPVPADAPEPPVVPARTAALLALARRFAPQGRPAALIAVRRAANHLSGLHSLRPLLRRAGRALPRRALLPSLLAAVVSLLAAGAWLTMPDTLSSTVRFLVPLVVIASARVLDVTLGVLRTVLVVSGRRMLAGVAAASEAGVWLAAAGFVLGDLSLARGIAFAAGVGIGTIIGMGIVRAAAWGLVTVRVFCPSPEGTEVANWLRSLGLGATVFTGQGRDAPRDLVLCVTRRREAHQILRDLDHRPGVFVTVDSDPTPGSNLHAPIGRL
jgi:uncharacterized protein YebE (UPF0316 family)